MALKAFLFDFCSWSFFYTFLMNFGLRLVNLKKIIEAVKILGGQTLYLRTRRQVQDIYT